MACLRCNQALRLFAALALVWVLPALAQETSPGLYDRPVLVVDPGMHTATIRRIDVDAAGRYAVTGSDDKTVRLWSLQPPRLERTIHLPAGPSRVGIVYAVALNSTSQLIAAGGWTTPKGEKEAIYLFNHDGKLLKRLEGLPNVVLHLVFSADDRYLAATLAGRNGIRVYDRDQDWQIVTADTEYGRFTHYTLGSSLLRILDASSYGASFAPDGRLATTSNDGHVRLYDRRGSLIAIRETTVGGQPFDIAFNPAGDRLAVGFDDSPTITVLDGHTLEPRLQPNTSGIDNGNLGTVAWSLDGLTLYAGGRFVRGGKVRVVSWADGGRGERQLLSASNQTVMSLQPLPDGELLVAAGDPYWAVLNTAGEARTMMRSPLAEFRGQGSTLAVSADGTVVDFGYEYGGKQPARFDLRRRTLSADRPAEVTTVTPIQQHTGLEVANWKDHSRPTLNGKPLSLLAWRGVSRSLAIHPDGTRLVLGTEWHLLAFDADGEQLWQQAAPGPVWAVNITGNGRLVVAAFGDGTIRWHRMDDGQELLAFFPLADRTNWVSWTPQGVYDATPGAHGVLRWHINHGFNAAAETIPVADIPEQFRPEVLPLVLQELDVVKALGLAELQKIRRAVQLRTNSAVPPGTQLHVLAIGVGDYNAAHAAHLRLKFAAADAQDVVSALVNTQQSLYARVKAQVLRNGEATKAGIFRALDTMAQGMQLGDVAVVHFSGHGALIDGTLYLLPYEVDARDSAAIKASALAIGQFRQELQRLAARGRVLVLLDACRAGCDRSLPSPLCR
jgi:WD40 repeat protein